MNSHLNQIIINLIKKLPETIYWVMDKEGTIIDCNDQQARVVGLTSAQDLQGKNINEIGKLLNWPLSLAEEIKENNLHIMQMGQGQVFEESINLNGEKRFFTSFRDLWIDENNKIIGVIGIGIDITDKKKAERLEQEHLVIQAKLNGMTQVAASIAHELRTPLVTINMGLKNLKNYFPMLMDAYKKASHEKLAIDKINPQIFKLLDEIPVSLERVTESAFLFIDMLLMNLEPSFKPAMEETTFTINQCIAKALETYPCTEEDKRLMHWINDENHDFVVRGKMLLVKHILYNLIKNSLYYIAKVGKGEIHIWTQKGQKYNTLYFKDTGSGIASDLVPKIFDRFFTQSEFGAGIGLTYCKMVMESLEGAIHCESKEGEYTLFRLEFPVI